MSLHIKSEQIEAGTVEVDAQQGGLSTKSIYGNDSSMTVATREPGYHSIPHRHDLEQLTYVVSGETWMFIGEDGFIATVGDFFRVPRNEVHWSWNTGSGNLVTFQSFAPALDPATNVGALGLFAPGEDETAKAAARNITPPDADRYVALEPQIMGDDYRAATS
jgi:quercetin dioxygenase-like cupin family protein